MSIYQKQIESERLNLDVEKWLAQNAIKSLPMGFTNFPDGKIPTLVKTLQESETERLEKQRKIAEHKELLKREKEKQREIKKAEAKQRQIERKKAKMEQLKAEKLAKQEAKQAELKALVKKHIEPKKRIHKPKNERWVKNKVLKAEAIAKGEKHFIGDCKHHGEVKFYIDSVGYSRCSACKRASILKYRLASVDPSRVYEADRVSRNMARKVEAVKQGLKTFKGECLNCGMADFEIKNVNDHFHSRCLPCRRLANKKSRAKGVAA